MFGSSVRRLTRNVKKFNATYMLYMLKLSRNKKDLNDVTAATFLVSFSQLPAARKNIENGAAVTSLRSIFFRDNFISK